MKVYVAGKMQGVPQFNFPAFFEAAQKLRNQGHTVFNPAQRDVTMYGEEPFFGSRDGSIDSLKLDPPFSLREALGDDTQFICNEADAIFMLKGWEESKGAMAEWALARALGLKIWYQS